VTKDNDKRMANLAANVEDAKKDKMLERWLELLLAMADLGTHATLLTPHLAATLTRSLGSHVPTPSH
jgi:hypothetical protein